MYPKLLGFVYKLIYEIRWFSEPSQWITTAITLTRFINVNKIGWILKANFTSHWSNFLFHFIFFLFFTCGSNPVRVFPWLSLILISLWTEHEDLFFLFLFSSFQNVHVNCSHCLSALMMTFLSPFCSPRWKSAQRLRASPSAGSSRGLQLNFDGFISC